MNERLELDRRTALKTIGVGVAGGTMLTGRAAAAESCNQLAISLEGHQFVPRRASVQLSSDGCAAVTWTNNESEQFGGGHDVPHDVHLEHDGTHLVHSSDNGTTNDKDTYLLPGDSYVVEFSENSGDLELTETYDDSKDSVETTATIKGWGGSVTLDTICEIHEDHTNMVGTLEITE